MAVRDGPARRDRLDAHMKLIHSLTLCACLLGGMARVARAEVIVLCFGDSITMGRDIAVPYPTRLANNTGYTTINGGRGGELASGGLARIDSWLAWCNPTHVLIMFGTNDINQPDPDTRGAASRVLQIAQRCRAYGAIPIVGTVPPMIGPRSYNSSHVYSLNSHLRSMAAAQNVLLADINAAFGSGSGLMNSDGFHPNDMGLEIIALTFAEKIEDILALSPESVQVPETGALGQSFAVEATSDWTAAADQDWITVFTGHGTGDGAVIYSVAANTGPARSGTITVDEGRVSESFTVSQDQALLSISPTTLCLPGSGATDREIKVTANQRWTVTTSRRSWVWISSGASGLGSGTITYNVAFNPGAARTAAIRVSIGGTTRTLRLNQWPVGTNANMGTDCDFDGDGLADLAVYNPDTAKWGVKMSTGARFLFKLFGSSTKVPVPGDYDGDGLQDFAVYHSTSGNWYILKSSNGRISRRNLGRWRTVPVPGDYDGDGTTDLATYHTAYGRWYFDCSTAGRYSVQWGSQGHVPVPADYDGDGFTDIAIYNPDGGLWQILRSSDGLLWRRFLGSKRNLPVPADYDGDGFADLAIYHKVFGDWRIRESTTGDLIQHHLGWKSTFPVPADYDGDGFTDPAVYHAASRSWYIRQSTDHRIVHKRWGGSAYSPVQAWSMIHDWLDLR